jgi:hypothetical protein
MTYAPSPKTTHANPILARLALMLLMTIAVLAFVAGLHSLAPPASAPQPPTVTTTAAPDG